MNEWVKRSIDLIDRFIHWLDMTWKSLFSLINSSRCNEEETTSLSSIDWQHRVGAEMNEHCSLLKQSDYKLPTSVIEGWWYRNSPFFLFLLISIFLCLFYLIWFDRSSRIKKIPNTITIQSIRKSEMVWVCWLAMHLEAMILVWWHMSNFKHNTIDFVCSSSVAGLWCV